MVAQVEAGAGAALPAHPSAPRPPWGQGGLLHRVREAGQETLPPQRKRITVQVGTSLGPYLARAEHVGGRQQAFLVMAAQK